MDLRFSSDYIFRVLFDEEKNRMFCIFFTFKDVKHLSKNNHNFLFVYFALLNYTTKLHFAFQG